VKSNRVRKVVGEGEGVRYEGKLLRIWRLAVSTLFELIRTRYFVLFLELHHQGFISRIICLKFYFCIISLDLHKVVLSFILTNLLLMHRLFLLCLKLLVFLDLTLWAITGRIPWNINQTGLTDHFINLPCMGFIEPTLDRTLLEYFLKNSVNKQQITDLISIYVL
jgi:hypothetical protein